MAAEASSRRRRASSLRSWSVSRREATVVSQDRGGQQRLLHGVLADVEVSVAADQRAEDLRCELTQQVVETGVGPQISRPPASMTGRTSIAVYRASGIWAASSPARSAVSHSTT